MSENEKKVPGKAFRHVSGCGGQSTTVSKKVWVGSPTLYTQNDDGSKNYFGQSLSYRYGNGSKSIAVHSDYPGNITYSWDMFPTNIVWGSNGNNAYFYTVPVGNYVLTCKADNVCGSYYYFTTIKIQYGSHLSLYPNPADNGFTASFASPPATGQRAAPPPFADVPVAVKIFGHNGATVLKTDGRTVGGRFWVDTSALPPGPYVVHLRAMGKTHKKQLLVK